MSQLSDALVPVPDVPIDQILLDPQNPRFESPVAIVPDTFATSEVQDATRMQLVQEPFGVLDLAESIRQIGFLPMDKVVVEALDLGSDGVQRYIVIEGNCRVAAIKSILKERLRRPITEELEQSISVLDVLALQPQLCELDRPEARALIRGVRHISGIREWGPYQQAVALRDVIERNPAGSDRLRQTPQSAAAALGLSYRVAVHDLNALGAYEQMREDEEYGTSANPRLFSYFVEAVGKPAIRTWLGFSNEERVFEDDDHRKLFYSWITADDSGFRKIREAQEVRKLVKIIQDNRALTALSNEDNVGIDAASDIANASASTSPIDWESALRSVVVQLENFPASRLSNEVEMNLLRQISVTVVGLLGSAPSSSQ